MNNINRQACGACHAGVHSSPDAVGKKRFTILKMHHPTRRSQGRFVNGFAQGGMGVHGGN